MSGPDRDQASAGGMSSEHGTSQQGDGPPNESVARSMPSPESAHTGSQAGEAHSESQPLSRQPPGLAQRTSSPRAALCWNSIGTMKAAGAF
jgi:hypothetical protein